MRQVVSAGRTVVRAEQRRLAARHPLAIGLLDRAGTADALRLLAAVAVVVSHSFAFVGHEQPTLGHQDLGSVGVWVFFGLSGFLVTQSWCRDPHLGRYLGKRALRILPALLVVLVLTVVVLGPAFTDLAWDAYFAHPETWRYLMRNSVMVTTHTLPGVFVDNPYPRAVNASLWTLRPETWAYLGLAAAGLVGALRRAWVLPLVAMVLIAWPHEPTGMVPWPEEVFLLQAFAVGAALYVLRDQLPWHWSIAAALSLAVVLAPSSSLQLLLTTTAIPYVALYLAYRGPGWLSRIAARGDYSYGVYIYGWPVGQCVVALWPGISAPLLIAVTLPVTVLLAVASWHVVEKPALALKHTLFPTGARAARTATVRG